MAEPNVMFGLDTNAIAVAAANRQQQQQQVEAPDYAGNMVKMFQSYISAANDKASSVQNEVRQRLDALKVGDLLGYKDGYFDTSDGLKMAQRAQDNYYKNAVKSYANAALGGLAYANGHIAEGLQSIAAHEEAARGAESMIGRIGDQTRVLQSGQSSDADKAIARQGLRKGFGKVEDIFTGMQSVSQLYPALVGTLVSADSFAAQTTANGMMALAQLTGMRGSRSVSGGGAINNEIRDILDIVDQQAKTMQAYGEANKSEAISDTGRKRLEKDYLQNMDVISTLLQRAGIAVNVDRSNNADTSGIKTLR